MKAYRIWCSWMGCNVDNCKENARSSMFPVHPESECGSRIIWQRRSWGLVVSKIFQEEQKRKEDERQKAVAEKKRLQEICFLVSGNSKVWMTWPLPFFPRPGDPFSYSTAPPSLAASPPRSPTQREQTTDMRTQTHTHTDTRTHTLWYTHLPSPTNAIDIYELWTPCGLYKIGKVGGFLLSSCKVSVFSLDTKQLRMNMNEQWSCVPSMRLKGPQRISTCCIQSWCRDRERKNKKRRKKRKGKKPTKNVARSRRNIRGQFFSDGGVSEPAFKHP